MWRNRRIQPASALIGFALIGLILINGLNLIVSAADAVYVSTLNLSYPPLLRIVAALGWMLAFGYLALGTMRGRPGVRRQVAPLLTLYGVWGVLWLLLFARSSYAQGRVAFQAALTVVLLLPFWWLHWRHV
jgi:hypothetical protein